jgi:hypothetical protein
MMTSEGATMDRRRFLRTSGKAAAGAAVVAASGTTMIVAVDGAWAMSLKSVEPHAAKTLLRMTRLLYPHDGLGDLYYAQVVEALDGEAAAGDEVASLLREGVAGLDGALGMPWLDLSEGYQLQVLRGMETSPFFQKVRGQTVVALYNNPLVWRHFGYEGSSYEYGGYLHRGFDDLGWLPEPPEDASPAAEE